MSEPATTKPPYLLGALLTFFGAVGLIAAFALTLDKINGLEHRGTGASCDFNLLVQCTKNLDSPQGAAFGFPNPLIGLICWSVVITIGMAIIAKARFSSWFWIGLNVGAVFALSFVIWLMYVSMHILATLCPYCMLTWSMVIPFFWVVTLHNLRVGHIPTTPGIKRLAAAAYGWIPLITLVCYLIVAIVAQVTLDWLRYI